MQHRDEADIEAFNRHLKLINADTPASAAPEAAEEFERLIRKYAQKAMDFLREDCGLPPTVNSQILVEASVVSNLLDDQDLEYVNWVLAIVRFKAHRELLLVLYEQKIKAHCIKPRVPTTNL